MCMCSRRAAQAEGPFRPCRGIHAPPTPLCAQPSHQQILVLRLCAPTMHETTSTNILVVNTEAFLGRLQDILLLLSCSLGNPALKSSQVQKRDRSDDDPRGSA